MQASASAEDDTALLRYLPAWHGKHCVWACWFWYVPLPHALHATVSALAAAAELRYLPAAHLLQLIFAALGWKRPASQAAQATSSVDAAPALVRCLPAAQLTHVALPLTGWNFPATHTRHTGYDCVSARHEPPPEKPAPQLHADLSAAMTPLGHAAATHTGYRSVPAAGPPPTYPSLQLHVDVVLDTEPSLPVQGELSGFTMHDGNASLAKTPPPM